MSNFNAGVFLFSTLSNNLTSKIMLCFFLHNFFFRNVDWWLVWCLWWIWWCMSDILMIHIIVFCQYTVISCHRTDKGVRYFWCHPRDQILFCWQFDKKNFMMLVAAFLSAFSFRCILYKILEWDESTCVHGWKNPPFFSLCSAQHFFGPPAIGFGAGLISIHRSLPLATSIGRS